MLYDVGCSLEYLLCRHSPGLSWLNRRVSSTPTRTAKKWWFRKSPFLAPCCSANRGEKGRGADLIVMDGHGDLATQRRKSSTQFCKLRSAIWKHTKGRKARMSSPAHCHSSRQEPLSGAFEGQMNYICALNKVGSSYRSC